MTPAAGIVLFRNLGQDSGNSWISFGQFQPMAQPPLLRKSCHLLGSFVGRNMPNTCFSCDDSICSSRTPGPNGTAKDNTVSVLGFLRLKPMVQIRRPALGFSVKDCSRPMVLESVRSLFRSWIHGIRKTEAISINGTSMLGLNSQQFLLGFAHCLPGRKPLACGHWSRSFP